MPVNNAKGVGAFLHQPLFTKFLFRKGSVLVQLFAGIGLLLCLTGCMKDPSLVAVKGEIPDGGAVTFVVPAGWPAPVYTFAGNELTQSRFELGRKLFYDVELSKDRTISCGSCHAQFAAFSHLDHPFSHGIGGLFGNRNAPGIFNMAFKPLFFWDGGVNNLENQPVVPIENSVEMDLPLQEAIDRLNASAAYPALFQKAYGSPVVNTQMLFRALGQFMAALISSNSRYDKYVRGEAGGDFTAGEIRGLALFRARCATCHKEPLFTDYTFRNNGLAPDAGLNDSGRAHITGLPADRYTFMVPSLRNVELTRPYSHDGRIGTLEDAVEHYRTGIFQSPTLDPFLKDGIALTDAEKADVVAFLKTLTDTDFVKDPRFAEPK